MCVCVPHCDMGVVSHHLLRKHLHMDVCVIELLPHLPQLTHGIVQVALAFTPAAHKGGKKSNIFLQRLTAQLSVFLLFASTTFMADARIVYQRPSYNTFSNL